jgi:regulator of sirC expression with transglutaminase-like and TPR domain
MSLHEYLLQDPGCRDLIAGAVHATAPLLDDPDPQPVSRMVDQWAFDLAARMPLPWNLHHALDELNAYLFRELELRGDQQTYDDPANAVLPLVIRRRRGLPISLAILWIGLARRLGLDAMGIGLPGHFLAGLRTDMGLLCFDPFHQGRALGEEEAARLVDAASGGRLIFEPSMLAPIPDRAVLTRLVRNLQVRYQRQEAWTELLWTCTHLALLEPADPEPFVSRARAHLRLGNREQALHDLEEAHRLRPSLQAEGWMDELRKG